MSKRSSPTLIGAFVVGAVVLGLVGVMIFGSGRFFRESYKYILYFESDVSGLSVGANVKLKGVKIGPSRASCSASATWPPLPVRARNSTFPW